MAVFPSKLLSLRFTPNRWRELICSSVFNQGLQGYLASWSAAE